MPISAWLVLYYFTGLGLANRNANVLPRVPNTGILCRPACYMSGSFYDGVVRPSVPWPFRKSNTFDCAKDGERDYCTGEIKLYGKWIMPKNGVKYYNPATPEQKEK